LDEVTSLDSQIAQCMSGALRRRPSARRPRFPAAEAMAENAKQTLAYVKDPATRKMLIKQYRAAGIPVDEDGDKAPYGSFRRSSLSIASRSARWTSGSTNLFGPGLDGSIPCALITSITEPPSAFWCSPSSPSPGANRRRRQYRKRPINGRF
jgi:hypothetical protein